MQDMGKRGNDMAMEEVNNAGSGNTKAKNMAERQYIR